VAPQDVQAPKRCARATGAACSQSGELSVQPGSEAPPRSPFNAADAHHRLWQTASPEARPLPPKQSAGADGAVSRDRVVQVAIRASRRAPSQTPRPARAHRADGRAANTHLLDQDDETVWRLIDPAEQTKPRSGRGRHRAQPVRAEPIVSDRPRPRSRSRWWPARPRLRSPRCRSPAVSSSPICSRLLHRTPLSPSNSVPAVA
jgi:hypothetical protein